VHDGLSREERLNEIVADYKGTAWWQVEERALKAEARVAEANKLVAIALDSIGRARRQWEDGNDEKVAEVLDESRDAILDWKERLAKKEAPRP
jgi:hypothetical protein